MKKINVLVTGAGSGVGQSIVKALNFSKLKLNIFLADINYLNAGLFRFKKSIIVPKVEKRGALKWYLSNLKKLKIDVLFVGSEYDLPFFSRHSELIWKKTKCRVCVSNKQIITMANDKYLNQNFLQKNNLPFLKTFLPKSLSGAIRLSKKLTFPFILKGRKGTSSRNVHLIKNLDSLKKSFKTVKNPIIQEHIGSKKSDISTEYTCSFFKTQEDTILGPFIMRRKILHGTSWIAEVNYNYKISKLIKKIAELINCIGSFNVQLRLTKKGPVPFEFNPRFSGTTSIRSYFGFNEPEMYIKNYLLNQKITNKQIKIKKNGVCFRYIEEIFLDNTNLKLLPKNMGKGKIIKWF